MYNSSTMTNPELTSLVLDVRPTAAYASVEYVGRAAHALALDAIRAADPSRAASLHDDPGPKPFTVSGLKGVSYRSATPDKTGTLRFTGLTAPVSAALLQAVDAGGAWEPGQTLTLASTDWQVVGCRIGADPSPWVAQATYETLSAPWLVGKRPVDRRIRLVFGSPTTFKSRDQHVPVPLPALVWGSLLERWNAFAPVALAPDVRRFAEECLALSRYELRTQMVPVKAGGLRAGAVGWAEYTALNPDPFWLAQIHILADFALYSGVGAGTSMGLGQVRPDR